jgi:transposase
MRFVPVKSLEQQSALLLHRTRDLLVAQRTQLANALRGHLAEFGVVVAQGIGRVRELVTLLAGTNDDRVPPLAREVLLTVVMQLREVEQKITELERQLLTWHRTNEVSRRLATIPGVGPITATALVATVGDPAYFRSGRQFAAWLGLVPRQRSSGGKEWRGGISKRGDGYLRRLLVHGARTVARWQQSHYPASTWLGRLLTRRPVNVATVALANKNARIAWALMVRNETFQAGYIPRVHAT